MPGQYSTVIVSNTVSKNPDPHIGVKPAHWVDNVGTRFTNPWESYRHHTFVNMLSVSTGNHLTSYSLLTIVSLGKKKSLCQNTHPFWSEIQRRLPNAWACASLPGENRLIPSQKTKFHPLRRRWRRPGWDTRAFWWSFHRAQWWIQLSNPPNNNISGVYVSYLIQSSAIGAVPVNTLVRKGTHVGHSSLCTFFRYNPIVAPPCTIDEIPEIDAVIISVSMVHSYSMPGLRLSSTITTISK
jgi:hypothetical protein